MSNHVSLSLHRTEEAISCDFKLALTPYPPSTGNPISDYFATTQNLTRKIISTRYADDSEVLGLLVLGVVSAAEFYFRSILSGITTICPLCEKHIEGVNIPAGSINFYSGTGFSSSISAFEHESLADSKKLIQEIKRYTGLSCPDNSSVKKALDDFEMLCEVRHCFVHARGFVGLKASRAINSPRTLQKLLIRQQQALDFIKLAHNAVRAVNRYLSDETINRWIQRDVLTGNWNKDRKPFLMFWSLFAITGEDSYSSIPSNAYTKIKPAIIKKRRAIAANIGGNT